MTHADLVELVLNRIDRVGLDRVSQVFRDTTWEKFFDVDPFVHAACQHALRFDEFLPRSASCIDIGCGFGYTALALEMLGHSCVAWDNDVSVLRNVSYHVPVRNWNFKTIVRNSGEELFGRYDLIFLHGVWPMRDAAGWWEVCDYQALMRSFMGALSPNGRIEIIINRGDELDKIVSGFGGWPGCDIADNVITVHPALVPA